MNTTNHKLNIYLHYALKYRIIWKKNDIDGIPCNNTSFQKKGFFGYNCGTYDFSMLQSTSNKFNTHCLIKSSVSSLPNQTAFYSSFYLVHVLLEYGLFVGPYGICPAMVEQ